MKRISTGSDAKILIPERIRIVAMLLYGRSSIPITVSVGPCQYCAPPRLRDELDSKKEDDSVRGRRISELNARPDLNGSYAVILPPEDEDERRRLEEQERVNISGYPKTLALKKENVKVLAATEVDAIDWSYGDFILPGETEKTSLLLAIRHPQSRLDGLDVCSLFADAVWNAVGRGLQCLPCLR